MSELTHDQVSSLGYAFARQLPTGEWIALQRMAYTVGLFVGLDDVGYRTRFCYPDWPQALIALNQWDGRGDPPGYWIKEKGRVERHNPRVFFGIPVVVEPRA